MESLVVPGISLTSNLSVLRSLFMREDFPTPDCPEKTEVLPFICFLRARSPVFVFVLVLVLGVKLVTYKREFRDSNSSF